MLGCGFRFRTGLAALFTESLEDSLSLEGQVRDVFHFVGKHLEGQVLWSRLAHQVQEGRDTS